MAASKSHHVRSNSFPTKSHPLLQHCNERLERLRSSSIATSSSSVSEKLVGVEDLYDSVEKLLQSQFARQAIFQSRHEQWVDRIVDGSLRLLDVCSVAKDAVLCTKECAREIQSAMRRKHHGLEIEVSKYSASRKLVKKTVRKASKGLKSVESTTLSSNQDNESYAVCVVLRQVEEVTLGIFDSLLSFISGHKAQTKAAGWFRVSKLMRNEKVCTEDEEANEFEAVDGSLHCLGSHEKARTDLRSLELCVQGFEERLDSLFRRLIKTRVSILNTLNN